jgi:MoxR-like ATPase
MMLERKETVVLGRDDAAWAGERVAALRSAIGSVVVGHERPTELLIACLIAGGHVLLEDVPGVGKTLLASTLARSIDVGFSRIQLTPDMLPADVLGVSVYDGVGGGAGGNGEARFGGRGGGGSGFRFVPGPLFSNIVLADEVNRTTPRTQSALLESMNEGTVSIDGVTHELERPFMVVATQNPFEFEGTYPLPENQLDRFLMRVSLGYPDAEAESRILEMHVGGDVGDVRQALDGAGVVRLQEMAKRVEVSEAVRGYIVSIAQATRSHEGLYLGLSPRGSLALLRGSCALALMRGRSYVLPDDVYELSPSVIGHRVIPRDAGDGRVSGVSGAFVEELLEGVTSPA